MKYLDFEDAIIIHKRVLGATRVALLSSGNLRFCLDQTRSSPEGPDFETALAVKAAQILYCIVRNHPFLDGNKRTSYQIAEALLLVNGYELSGVMASEVIHLLSGIAEGKVSIGTVISWVRKHLRKSGVRF